MTPIWGWIADAVLAVLLLGTLGMVIRLDRAMRMVRQDRAVFEALISNLSSATSSVKAGIQALRHEADRAAEQIGRRSEEADKMATDLSFLIEAADRAGASLEDRLRSLSRDPAPAGPPAAKARKLRAAVMLPKRRRVEAATGPAAPALGSVPVAAPPAPVARQAAAQTAVARSRMDELRALAGITTRPRARRIDAAPLGASPGIASPGTASLGGAGLGEPASSPRGDDDLIMKAG